MTPQHIFVSISLQVIREGEFWIWLKIVFIIVIVIVIVFVVIVIVFVVIVIVFVWDLAENLIFFGFSFYCDCC